MSIQSQTLENWECIIVDDFSNSETLELIEEFVKDDVRFNLIRKGEKDCKGANSSRNLGLDRSLGEYILFMDSDDLIKEDSLEKRVSLFRLDSTLDVLISPGISFKSNNLGKLISSYNGLDPLRQFLKLDVPGIPINITWRRSFLLKNDLKWNSELPFFQDLDFHVLAFSNNPNFAYAHYEPDCFWRKHSSGNIGKTIFQEESLTGFILLSHSLARSVNKDLHASTLIELFVHFYYKIFFLVGPETSLKYLKSIRAYLGSAQYFVLSIFYLLMTSKLLKSYRFQQFVIKLFRAKSKKEMDRKYFCKESIADFNLNNQMGREIVF